MKTFYLMLVVLLVSALHSCQESIEIEEATSIYSIEEYQVLTNALNLPEKPFLYGFGNSETGLLTDHKGTLGRILFYDKNLSSDGSVACASCHQQSLAFADNKAFSTGPNGNLTARNSIALGGLRSFGAHYQISNSTNKSNSLFWDERAASIKEQLIQTINNPNEMDMSLTQIRDMVGAKDYYRVLYEKAYGSTEITEDHILESIEIFINSISSTNSKLETEVFDNLNFINGDEVTGSTGHELGLQLFQRHCNSCHTTSLHHFLDVDVKERITAANNGLVLESDDLGIYLHSKDPEDIGKFKIPGLHNIALTAPYMHDGRFTNLEEVVEYYNSGITTTPNLHPNLKKGNEAQRLLLTQKEKTALVNFLTLLTDESIRSEQKWSDPFLY